MNPHTYIISEDKLLVNMHIYTCGYLGLFPACMRAKHRITVGRHGDISLFLGDKTEEQAMTNTDLGITHTLQIYVICIHGSYHTYNK